MDANRKREWWILFDRMADETENYKRYVSGFHIEPMAHEKSVHVIEFTAVTELVEALESFTYNFECDQGCNPCQNNKAHFNELIEILAKYRPAKEG
jgi:hypothetical protein